MTSRCTSARTHVAIPAEAAAFAIADRAMFERVP